MPRGGFRPGAGAKPVFKEATKTVRVPTDQAGYIRRLARLYDHPPDFLVWWVSQAVIDRISPEAFEEMPVYLQELIEDRSGRPGRLRIWAADGFPQQCSKERVPDLPDTYGGIVIHGEDIGFCLPWGGFIREID